MKHSAAWTARGTRRTDGLRNAKRGSADGHAPRERAPSSSGSKGTRPDIQAIIDARRARERIISRELFGDPAWDILLALYGAELDRQRISTTALCVAAAVPSTTALRWIEKLEHLGFLTRTVDPRDGRRLWVALSQAGSAKMHDYFHSLSPPETPV